MGINAKMLAWTECENNITFYLSVVRIFVLGIRVLVKGYHSPLWWITGRLVSQRSNINFLCRLWTCGDVKYGSFRETAILACLPKKSQLFWMPNCSPLSVNLKVLYVNQSICSLWKALYFLNCLWFFCSESFYTCNI